MTGGAAARRPTASDLRRGAAKRWAGVLPARHDCVGGVSPPPHGQVQSHLTMPPNFRQHGPCPGHPPDTSRGDFCASPPRVGVLGTESWGQYLYPVCRFVPFLEGNELRRFGAHFIRSAALVWHSQDVDWEHPMSTRAFRLGSVLCAFAIAAVPMGCGNRPTRETQVVVDPHSVVPTTVASAIEGRSTWGEPMPISGRSIVLVPFSVRGLKEDGEFLDPFASRPVARDITGQPTNASGGSWRPIGIGQNTLGISEALASSDYYDFSRRAAAMNVRWHNAVVREIGTAREAAILDQRGIISGWAALQPPEPEPASKDDRPRRPPVEALVFLVTLEDTSKDGTLNYEDARHAIMGDGEGRNLRAVTPPGAHVRSYDYDAARGLVYFEVVDDTDGNGKFEFSDVARWWVLDLRKGAPAVASLVVSDELTRRVERAAKGGAGAK